MINSMVGPRTTITARRNKEQCPICGELADMPEGTFRAILKETVKAIRSPDVSRADIERLRDLASRVKAGQMPAAAADKEASKFSQPLKAIWNAAGTPQAAFLVTLLSLILMMYFHHADSAQGAEESSRHAQQAQIERTILEELQSSHPHAAETETKAQPKESTKSAPQEQKPWTVSQITRQQWRAIHKPWKNRPPRKRG